MGELADLADLVESDGEPMGETQLHVDQLWHLIAALEELARREGLADALVGGNLNFYYDAERRQRRVCPDVFWARGLVEPRRPRRVYALWVEGKGPDLVIEVASQSTWEEDLGPKKALYRDVLKVAEYVVFDPEGGVLPGGPLLGWRLSGRAYRPIRCRPGAPPGVPDDARGRQPGPWLESRVLGATLGVIDGSLRVIDARGAVVPWDPSEGEARGLAQGVTQGVTQGVAQERALALERLRRLVRIGLEARLGSFPADFAARLAGAEEDAVERVNLALMGRDDLAVLKAARAALGLGD